MHGYANRILWINLKHNETKVEIISESIARMFIGGRGLGLRLIFDLGLDVDIVDPYGP
ncbi:MAG: aldehyde ferredoxin oxidoreductase N-terminal domain-containing protein, partial [Vulcanisaeta sp.]